MFPSIYGAAQPKRRAKKLLKNALIAKDRKALRKAKFHLALATNAGLMTGGVSALVMAAAKKKGPKALLRDVKEAEIKLHHDMAKAKAQAEGRKAPPLAEIRAKHGSKSQAQYAAEAVAEQKDSSGATADKNDAVATGSDASEVAEASGDEGSDTHDAELSVGVSADTNVGLLKNPWYWGGVAAVATAAYVYRGKIKQKLGMV